MEKLKRLARFFKRIFLNLVVPFERDIKERLLNKYKIINEGELFCSDFKYRYSDEKSNDFMGFLGKSNEETIADIN